jgi:threonine dehydratase
MAEQPSIKVSERSTAGPDDDYRISLANIEAAAQTIDPVFLNSPQYVNEPLSDLCGARLVVKVETANPIRSFKGRGADFFISGVAAGSHVVTASAGNLGQAMAYAARKRGVDLTIYASTKANPLKIDRMRALGATVILHGEDFDAAKAEAKRVCAETGAPMVEDGREPRLSEGAGTIAVELLGFQQRIDTVVVALGNGAILGGMARYLKAHAPHIEVLGVAAAGAPCMERSWRSGSLVETARVDTIADGMGTRIPIPEALGDMRGTVDDVLLVEDDAMIEAMKLSHRHLGLVLEPSGAAGLAALLANQERFRGKTVATVLCGGNLTPEQMVTWLS